MNHISYRKHCLPIIIFYVFVLTAVSCSLKTKSTDGPKGFDNAYNDAQVAKKTAETGQNVWRDSGKTLNKAKTAADAGKTDQAIALAIKAKNEYDMAFKQIQDNERYLKTALFYDPNATPEEDVKKIQQFFRDKFPTLSDGEFANGFYALNATMRENWEAIEEFPPYVPHIEEGEALWNTPLINGKTYSDCFNNPNVAAKFPRWDKKAGEVETLPMAINKCRESNGDKPFKYSKSKMLALQSYMAYESRGSLTYVFVPPDDPRAIEAYQKGKKFYFSRRGQLNLSCYHCHFNNAGNRIRSNILGPTLGQTTHWPSYRSKWGDMGSLHKRYKGCNKQVRAKPFKLQGEEYRNLEFFHTFLSNGIPTNGPGTRF